MAWWKKKTIAIHILPDISRSEGNQAMKFDQSMEYNMRNIFLKNHAKNVVGKLFLDPFLKKQHWAYFLINSLKSYKVCFYCMLIWGLSIHIKNKLQTTCFYLIQSFFFMKVKEVWTWSPCLIFCMIFEEKYFSCYILLLYSRCLHCVRYLVIYVL